MKNICIVVSSPMTVNVFLKDQVLALSNRYKMSIVANTQDIGLLDVIKSRTEVIHICIERKISLINDIKAFFSLYYMLSRKNYAAVHSVTPKAGLLAMSAAFFARIPVRIHTFTGQIWANSTGIKKLIFKLMDRMLTAFSTHILIDSNSQKTFLVEQGIVSKDKSRVLAKGSISGVDTELFKPDLEVRADLRNSLDIRKDDVVFLYLGRLNKDKGLLDLGFSFSRICAIYDNVHLLIVGPDEEDIKACLIKSFNNCLDKIHFIDYTGEPQNYMACADVFCLPSYREGFGSVIIEAASTGIPSAASRIYGITDAVEDGITGLLHEAGNTDQLIEIMKRFIDNPDLRETMGEKARVRAVRDYPNKVVTEALLDYYNTILR